MARAGVLPGADRPRRSRAGDVPERRDQRLHAAGHVGVGRRLLHDRRLQRQRQPDVAARQPQPEVRHGVPLLRRAREPVSHGRLADAELQQPVDSRSDRQRRRCPSRAGPRLVHARVSLRRVDEPRGGLHREEWRALVLRAQRLARAQQPHGEPRAALRVRIAAHRVARSHDQRLRPVGGVADQRGGGSGLCALTDCGSAGAGVPRPWRRALPRHRRAWRGMAGRPQQLHAARRFLVAAGHGHRRARRLRPLLRRARSEPHQRQPDGLLAGHVARAVARQRPDVHRDARESVS